MVLDISSEEDQKVLLNNNENITMESHIGD